MSIPSLISCSITYSLNHRDKPLDSVIAVDVQTSRIEPATKLFTWTNIISTAGKFQHIFPILLQVTQRELVCTFVTE